MLGGGNGTARPRPMFRATRNVHMVYGGLVQQKYTTLHKLHSVQWSFEQVAVCVQFQVAVRGGREASLPER